MSIAPSPFLPSASEISPLWNASCVIIRQSTDWRVWT